MTFRVRPFAPGDAPAVDALWRSAFAGFEADYPGAADALAAGPALLAQTGGQLILAEDPGGVAAVARWVHDEGIAWVDMLASGVPWAGRAVLAGVGQCAQDAGIRLLRATVPDRWSLPGYFQRAGFQVIGRRERMLTMERRLPLLTVREQRTSDAAAIASLAGLDPWPFEQGRRPGWFVLADGERVAGVVSVRADRAGVGHISEPIVAPGYGGRAIEAWMLDRAADWASTNACHTVTAPFTPGLKPLERVLEDRGWHPEAGHLVRRVPGRTHEGQGTRGDGPA
jgi:GNAT superfamily N-acetyltransferase